MKKVLVVILLIAFLVCFVGAAFAAVSQEPTPEQKAAEAARQKQLAQITLIILAVAAVLFITEIIPLAVTAMSVPVALAITKVLDAKAAFSGLSNSNVVLFAGMFVVGAALFETGVAKKIGDTVVKSAGTSETKLALGVMVIAAGLSSVLSNTGTTAVLLPVAIGIANSAGWNRGRILMPLALAAGLGGTITLVGTPPNLAVNAALSTADIRQFGFFEFGLIGIPLTIAGIIYMLTLGRKLLPDRKYTGNDEDVVAVQEEVKVDPTKQWISAGILVAVVLVMAFFSKQIPLHVAATAGAVLCVLTGTIDEKKAYRSIDWTTIFLFAGMLPLADAMAQTGAGKMIADVVIGILGSNASPYLIMSAMYWLTTGLTQFMSNTASSALLAPICLAIAQGIGASPHAILMSVAIGASCAFATPVGTPPNTLVLGPGGFRFMDYVKVGLPLIVICYIVALILVPIIWPFF
ncbi:MAG: SLC13 family permease [Peptococcaceae bacterium]